MHPSEDILLATQWSCFVFYHPCLKTGLKFINTQHLANQSWDLEGKLCCLLLGDDGQI